MLILVIVLSSILNLIMLLVTIRTTAKFQYVKRKVERIDERVAEGLFDRLDGYWCINPQDFDKMKRRTDKMWKLIKRQNPEL